MCNKVRFMHKIHSDKAPTYLSEKVSINHYSRNCSRKLNVPTPRLHLFKSSLMYSGPTLWNSLPIALTETSTVSVFKSRLSKHAMFLGYNLDIKTGMNLTLMQLVLIKLLLFTLMLVPPPPPHLPLIALSLSLSLVS